MQAFNDVVEVSLRKHDGRMDPHGVDHTCWNCYTPHSNTAASWEVDSSVARYHLRRSIEGSNSEEDTVAVVRHARNWAGTNHDDTIFD